MEDSRSWSVEAKKFEVSIKGGGLGVRIFESSKKKKSTIFIKEDELTWLMGALEEVVDVDRSEVFWDQSRAGYPRIIAQKCSNRHGRFVTIEEFDGRRRIGSIFIPEGRFGQGWARFIVELDRVSSSLRKGRQLNIGRVSKAGKVVIGRRNHVEMKGLLPQPEEEYVYALKAPNAKVLTHLEEESAELERAKRKGKLPITYAQAVEGGAREKASNKMLFQTVSACDSREKEGGATGSEKAPVCMPQAKVPTGVVCSLILELLKRREGAGSTVLSAFKAKQELCSIREWLGQLRGEVDAGIERLDVVINTLKADGSGQRKWVTGRISKYKSKRNFKPSIHTWARKKLWAQKKGEMGSGSGPEEAEADSEEGRTRACTNSTERGTVAKVSPGPMVAIGCVEGFRRLEVGSTSKQSSGDHARIDEGTDEMGLLRSAPERQREAKGGISGEVVQSEEGLRTPEEEISASWVEDSEVSTGKRGKLISRSPEGLG